MNREHGMSREHNGFTATQIGNGFHISFHDNPEEIDVSITDLNEFANKYAKEMLAGRKPELSDKEEVMFYIWEMVLIPNDIVH